MLYLASDVESGGRDHREYDLLQAGFALYSPSFAELWAYEFGISLQKYRTQPEALAINKLNLNHLRMTGLVDPQMTLPYIGDGFNLEHYEAQRQLGEMKEKLEQLNKDRVEVRLLCHNVPFDKSFLELWFPWLFKLISYRSIDTIGVALAFHDAGRLPTKNVKLTTLTEFFHIEHGAAHSALADARACVQLYELLVGMIRCT